MMLTLEETDVGKLQRERLSDISSSHILQDIRYQQGGNMRMQQVVQEEVQSSPQVFGQEDKFSNFTSDVLFSHLLFQFH